MVVEIQCLSIKVNYSKDVISEERRRDMADYLLAFRDFQSTRHLARQKGERLCIFFFSAVPVHLGNL